MSRIGSHINTKLADSRPIALDVAALRQVAQGVLRVGRPFELLGFRLADNHLHAVLAEDHVRATEFARRVELSIQARLRPGVRFQHVWVTPIESQSHLRRSFLYGFRQEEHHGTEVDPLYEASNLPDLLGARTIGRWTVAKVRQRLPRIGRPQLESFLPVTPAESNLDLDLLPDAAAAAIGAKELASPGARAADLRAAAAHSVRGWASRRAMAEILGVHPRSVIKMLAREADPDLVRAIDAQLRWRTAWSALQAATRD